MVKRFSGSAFVVLAVVAFASAAQTPEQAPPQVTILAEEQHRSADGVVHAEGNVNLTYHGLTIDADAIDFAPDFTGGPEVKARGNVVLRRDGDVLRCSELRLELATGRGEFRLR